VRKWLAASTGLALLACGTAQGQTGKGIYPDRPVRMIVPFAAGGPGDIFARLIGQKLSEQLGQQFVIENRPGAGGNIGTGAAARAASDRCNASTRSQSEDSGHAAKPCRASIRHE